MKLGLVSVAMIALLVPCARTAAQKTTMDGFRWEKSDTNFKLGWVSGYARAMDNAAVIQMARCASEMPMYAKEYPNVDRKVIMQKMCLSSTEFD